MKTKNLLAVSVIISVLFILCSCKKDKNNSGNGKAKRMVKFEITGNYTGKLSVAYTTPNGGVESATISTLPWTKEITYNSVIAGIAIGGDTNIPDYGVPGQTVTIKIFSGGAAVVNGTPAIVKSTGIVNLPSLTYAF